MAQEEVFGTRSRAYSAWHRRKSTGRFVGEDKAKRLGMIDVDAALFIEYHDETKEPVALIETAIDVGQPMKPTTVLKRLAKRCTPVVPAFCVLYTQSEFANPADPGASDILEFRVRRVWPEPETVWMKKTPEEYAEFLLKLRGYSLNQLLKARGFY
jgi:hypothetical protein